MRRRLPVTRQSITHRVEIHDSVGGIHDVYIIIGLYPATKRRRARPGELFIKVGKEGSTLRGLLDVIGIQTSLLLQNGVRLKDICTKMKDISFEPSGRTDDPTIPECKSLVDYIFRFLGEKFDEC